MTSHPATQAQGRFPARTRIMNQAPSTGGAMPHPPSPDDRRAGPRLAISLLVFSALMLSALPLARAAEPEASVEAAPAPGAGPLSPVRREAPAAQSTSSNQTPVAKKPTITMPAPATTPAADAGASSPPPAAKPQPKEAEHATSSASTPKTANPPPKQAEQASPVAPSVPNTTKPQQTQAQEATPPRPHRKPSSARSTASASNPPDQTFPAERRSAVI